MHDDQDLTQRHHVPAGTDASIDPLTRGETAPGDPAAVDGIAASPDADADATAQPIERYSPPPEARTDWSRRDEPEQATTPSRWYEPATAVPAVEPVGARPVTSPERGGMGMVLGAALLSAVLASGGTVVALNATGALDRSGPAAAPTGSTVGASGRTNQPVTLDESSATIDVAAAISPAVVRITTNGTDTSTGIIPSTGVGSGVIYDANGWILTNRHVVEGSDRLTVELNDGREFSGTVYGIDTLTDLAIVKIEASGLPTAPLGDSSALKVGQLVIAIGSPLGTFTNSVTSGIVSAKGRSITTDRNQNLNNLIQTDAAINPGNSGGPLLDVGGNVIGINTAIATDSNGIGFAIPIGIARPIMEQALAGEELSRPYMGVVYRSIDVQVAREEDLPVEQGALVVPGGTPNAPSPAVVSGGPADRAGIREGDIIVKVGDQVIDGDHPLDATLSEFAPGETVTIEVLRDGQTLRLPLTLGTRPSDL